MSEVERDDQARFSELVERHSGIVRKVAATYCGDPVGRADLSQDILANLWAAWPRYDADRPFSTWMYRIALNVALSHVRDIYRVRRMMVPLGEEHNSVAALGPDYAANRMLDIVYTAMADFDPLNRAILLLYLDDRSHREIAEIFGIGESNVGTKINRMQQKLRAKLA